MDDHVYVLNNVHIRHLDMNLLRWAFGSLPIDLWQPLTWISLAFDYHFWKLDPFGYHLTNNLLHALNTALVLAIADSIIRKVPALKERLCSIRHLYPLTLLLAGLLFGLHPLRVESVVWITERKDVLNGVFTFGSILFYLKHAEMQPVGGGWFLTRNYLISLILFALSLMAKPVSVVLPAIFLALDWYPLARCRRGEIRQLLLEKAPYLVLSAIISALTLYFASKNLILRPYAFLTPWQRLMVSGNAIFEYCRLLLFPVGISPLKLIPTPIPAVYAVKSSAVLLVTISLFAARGRRWLSATWVCFLLPLLPVLAIFQNGDQAFAARYTYLPSLAPAIAAAVFSGIVWIKLRESGKVRMAGVFVAFILAELLFFAVMTFHLTRSWDNPETYWTRVLTVDPVAKPYFERGEYFAKEGRFDEAAADYTRAIEKADGNFRKYVYNIYAFRGEALRSTGRYEDAVRDFSAAIRMSPHRIYYYSRGQALKELGRDREAEGDLRIAGGAGGAIGYWYTDPSSEELEKRLEKNPDDAEALAARAVSAVRQRKYQEAQPDFNRAIMLNPDRDSYYWHRSTFYLETGQTERALEDCSAVIRLNPRHTDAYLRRGSFYAEKGEYLRALDDLNIAIDLDKYGFEGYANRGLLLYRLGRNTEAVIDFNKAITLKSDSAPLYYNRGLALAGAGEREKAQADLQQAKNLGYEVSESDMKKALGVGIK